MKLPKLDDYKGDELVSMSAALIYFVLCCFNQDAQLGISIGINTSGLGSFGEDEVLALNNKVCRFDLEHCLDEYRTMENVRKIKKQASILTGFRLIKKEPHPYSVTIKHIHLTKKGLIFAKKYLKDFGLSIGPNFTGDNFDYIRIESIFRRKP